MSWKDKRAGAQRKKICSPHKSVEEDIAKRKQHERHVVQWGTQEKTSCQELDVYQTVRKMAEQKL